jgi:phosphoglycolate phosphatase
MTPKFPAQKVIFDLDGTLVDTAADLHAATNHCLASLGRAPVDFLKVRHLTGFGAIRLLEIGLSESGGSEGVDFEALRREFLGFYGENISVHSKPYPGCEDMLAILADTGIPVAVCTNKPYRLAEKLLLSLGLYEKFQALTGSDTFPFRKPDPRHVVETAAILEGNGPAIMVGDSSSDILAAQAANIPAIAVDYGYPDVPVKSLKPDAIISNLPDLLSLLDLRPAG